jgi:hypothetical protein
MKNFSVAVVVVVGALSLVYAEDLMSTIQATSAGSCVSADGGKCSAKCSGWTGGQPAGSYTYIGGAAVSVQAALTGLWDTWKTSEAATQPAARSTPMPQS